MRVVLVALLSLFILSGCAVIQPGFGVSKKDENGKDSNISVEKNVSIISTLVEEKVIENDDLAEGRLIKNIFDDELYFEKDKVGVDKTQVVIKYIDAFSWEKKALKKIYKSHKSLWSKQQSEDFRQVLEEDRYLSLCGDRRYWDNLEFEESEPERDIIQSLLLIRYLNNLEKGCPKWIESNETIHDENEKEHINTKQIFSFLPHGVIIKKLLSLYLPEEKKFFSLLKEHKASLDSDKKTEVLKAERLRLEKYKCKKCNPTYRRK